MANAPHIPVHLGAMQEAVQWQVSHSFSIHATANSLSLPLSMQLQHLEGELKEGDVILSNHPASGGSHLPDLTVITPVSTKTNQS